MDSSNKILNFNVGVLGHIDSGKTSLAKALSTVASTASFDKNPQSRERGITLDLGFSSFTVDAPNHIGEGGFNRLQFTLVDCPGHASLIKTIIGGAQIVDMIMLVVDITKGVQTQTAECLVIGEITCRKMVVVLNKIDLISEDKRAAAIEKMKKRMWKTLETTRFADCGIVAVAARPGGVESGDTDSLSVVDLIDTLKANSYIPKRKSSGPLLFSIDHCFLIKGQGTVMTGTMLSGSIAVNDTIEISSLKITKKVKSIQMFKSAVNNAIQGDRIGICVTQFDPKQLERGLVCSPGHIATTNRIITTATKIRYFKGAVESKSGKYHVTIGHETTMGKCTFFREGGGGSGGGGGGGGGVNDVSGFDFTKDYIYLDELPENKETTTTTTTYALIELDHPTPCDINFLTISSKLDTDIHSNTCRLAFHGRIASVFPSGEKGVSALKVYKTKSRQGVVERKLDECTLVCRNLFKKETNFEVFTGLKVSLSTGESGFIEGSFGLSGKAKIRIPAGLNDTTSKMLATTATNKKSAFKSASNKNEATDTALANQMKDTTLDSQDGSGQIKVTLEFKRYIFDGSNKIVQS